jgi:ParB-like chromosome segregation protein Spo0J
MLLEIIFIQNHGKKKKMLNKHPISNVKWVNIESINSNDYNPNYVAPPEMELLELSIVEDGFTQPIVVWEIKNNKYEIVDGFHRFMVGKKLQMEQLPVVIINDDRKDRPQRISSTIRHNRARGKHTIDGMSKIVMELKKRGWSDYKISKKIGMDSDEVLRLSQITGLAEMFANKEFSKAWEADSINDDDNLIDE